MKDAELLVLKVLKSKDAKQKYIMYHLRTHWADIIGHTAANHSQPYRLENGVLYLHTDNPAWSHNLMMMQGQLLGKINQSLPGYRPGRHRIIRELKFYHGILDEPAAPKLDDQGPFIPKVDPNRRCPVCGVPLIGDEEICATCARKQLAEKRREIRRALEKSPWLRWEDCRETLNCDRITFTDVKAVLEEWAMNEALKPDATDLEKAFAVMLDRELTPDKLNPELVERILSRAKRSRFYVPARGK